MQGVQLVLLLLQKITEGLDHRPGQVGGLPVKAGLHQFIQVERVQYLLVALLDGQQDMSQGHIPADEGGGLAAQFLGGGFDGFGGRVGLPGGLLGRGPLPVGVNGVQQGVDEIGQGLAARSRADGLLVGGGQPLRQPRQPPGQAGEEVFTIRAAADQLQQPLEGDEGLALQRLGIQLGVLHHADGIHDYKMILAGRVPGDAAQGVGG